MQNSARRHQWYDNVGVVVLGTQRASSTPQGSLTGEEQEVVDALDKKYDAIRDKLLLQVSGGCVVAMVISWLATITTTNCTKFSCLLIRPMLLSVAFGMRIFAVSYVNLT